MSLKVAITRALPGAETTARRLRARGAVPVLAPLLTIAPRPFDADVADAQALAFTSAAGVRRFAEGSERRDLPAFAVGAASAAAARAAGFTNVQSADGDVAALARLARALLDPARGPVLHISGAHVAGDLVGALTEAGFSAERRVAYEAECVTATPEGLRTPVDIVLFHSARAGEAYLQLGAPHAALMRAACLSAAVAAAAGAAAWVSVVIAPHPNDDALVQAALGTPAGP